MRKPGGARWKSVRHRHMPATANRGNRLLAHDLSSVFGVMPIRVVQEWLDQNGLNGARAIARLLPAPFLQDGAPSVPELTALVMDRFGADEEVLDEFRMGAGNN